MNKRPFDLTTGLKEDSTIIQKGIELFGRKPFPVTFDGGMVYPYYDLLEIFTDARSFNTDEQLQYSTYLQSVFETMKKLDIMSDMMSLKKCLVIVPIDIVSNDDRWKYVSVVFLNEDPYWQIPVRVYFLDSILKMSFT